ncbi:MAG: 23S rRNA (adenine(2503)-C(2))-methyltransferase RlmN [Kiritimatiellae bacterium]|nr:23S rRNA (adenine(2503)-C(2))-methyltransferase RlmN [Kiritimatiellia bacterium]
MTHVSVYSLPPEAVAAAVAEAGAPKFRARQILEGLYGRCAASWDAVTNLPRDLRAFLASRWLDLDGTLAVEEVAGEESTGTRKILGRLADGEFVETVLIPAPDGRVTACVSSQVGCPCRCAFCASGIGGCVRSLSSGEIVAQMVRASLVAGRRPDNVVFMGIGEPFLNYDSVMAAIRRLNAPAPEGLGIGARRITVSTSGIVPGIERFAGEGLQVELSVSLHAPDDETRSRLMPVNRRWPLGELVPACRAYTEKTGRIVTFEYTLVSGVNDSPAHAKALLRLLRPFPSRVNLIPLNPVPEFGGVAPPPASCEDFRLALVRGGLNATLRRSKGRGVNASCGQLRRARALEAAAR